MTAAVPLAEARERGGKGYCNQGTSLGPLAVLGTLLPIPWAHGTLGLKLIFGLRSRSFVSVVLGLNCPGMNSASIQ